MVEYAHGYESMMYDGGNCNMNQEDEVPHQYDYIIIGAGPSACGLLHGLLSREQHNISSKHQTPRITICIIEAGSQETSTTNAKDWPKTAFTNTNLSVPQSALNNRVLDVPIGSGLGGTSNINACLLSSPNFDHDFKCWPAKYQDGKVTKSACDYLVSFMRSNGSMTDGKGCEKFMNVLGDEYCIGSGDMQQHNTVRLATASDGKRINYFDSLVQPLIDQQQQGIEDSLTIRTNTIAERLLWDENNKQKQITGVVCNDQQSNQKYIISAKKEVILCTGAIHSPVLLMRSGIGDESELRKLDIHNNTNKSYHNLPGVGKKLKDHLVIPRAFLTTSSQVDCCQSLNGVQTIFNDTNKNDDVQYLLMDGCILKHAGPLMASSVFRRDYQHTNNKKINTYIKQYTFHIVYTLILTILQWAVKYIKPITHFMTYHTSTLLITILHPKSHGAVTLTSSNQIRIDPAYLTDESDLDSVVSAWNQSTRIKNTAMNKSWEILPGSLYRVYSSLSSCWGRSSREGSSPLSSSNDEKVIITYAKQYMQPYFHYIGTCSMINNTNYQSTNDQEEAVVEEEAVVDENFKVIGIQGLRICDASVFVDCISAPTALTCASLGYILSDILMKKEEEEGRS